MNHQKKIFQALGLVLAISGVIIGSREVDKIQNLISFASKKPAAITVDAQGEVGPLVYSWSNFAQGGEGTWFSVAKIADQLTPLSPRYIRIDHLYDYYVRVSRVNNRLVYDFSKLDQLLKEMRQFQAVPFVSLSYMPDILNSDLTGAPSDWQEYQAIIQRTIEHVSGTRELNIKEAYYEVWNEPDLFGQWKTYGSKNYLMLYKYAANGAEKAQSVNSFKFGGPATTKLYDNWVNELASLVVRENLRFDFYSWHHYNSDPEAYVDDVSRLKNLMKSYPDLALKVEYIISEWGIDSDINPAYDNAVSAAHTIASVISFPDNLDKAFMFEIQDGKSPNGQEFWGRWGILTHPDFGSKPKLRARAIYLLNQLTGQRLSVSGQGSWVKALAVRDSETLRILLVNYDYAAKHTENVPLTIKRLVPGQYRLTKTYLGRSKTSAQINIGGDTYAIKVPLPPNSVILYELARIP